MNASSKLQGLDLVRMGLAENRVSSLLNSIPVVNNKKRLATYRRTLRPFHGDILRLRVYSVAAVGFDRLVWEEEVKNKPF